VPGWQARGWLQLLQLPALLEWALPASVLLLVWEQLLLLALLLPDWQQQQPVVEGCCR
jgi:hypothetical protein